MFYEHIILLLFLCVLFVDTFIVSLCVFSVLVCLLKKIILNSVDLSLPLEKIIKITKKPKLKEMTLTYLFSGSFMLIFMLLKINTSAHACSFIGPVVFLSYSISIWFLLALPLLYFVIWSSLKLKRHTLFELISGCLIPVVSFLLAILII